MLATRGVPTKTINNEIFYKDTSNKMYMSQNMAEI